MRNKQSMSLEEFRCLETHDQFMNKVIQAAETFFGFKRIYHPWKSFHSEAGFPDLVMVNPSARRLIFAEIKKEGAKLTPAQQEWIDTLKTIEGIEVYVWYPHDWLEIEKILTNGTHGVL